MKSSCAGVLIIAALAVAGCNFVSEGDASVSTKATHDSTDRDGRFEDIVILAEGETVEGLPSNVADVTEVRLQGDTLTLTASFSGGCKEHELDLYASSSFVETTLPGAKVWLSHDAHGDLCEAWGTAERSFDLTSLQRIFEEKYPEGEAFSITVHEPVGDYDVTNSGEFERIEAGVLRYEW